MGKSGELVHYNLHLDPCTSKQHKSKPNCQSNPNCLYGLGEVKKGIWQAKPNILKELGTDPAEYKRMQMSATHKRLASVAADRLMPTGLKNLGATCYLNSMLQYLFVNTAFRRAVYQWRPNASCASEKISQMRALQRVFSYMQLSDSCYFDPVDFANTLALNNTIQQDAQEFNKLLLTHLEKIFSNGLIAKDQTIVQDLFRGSLEYVTTCLTCQKVSRRPSTFYELALSLKGHDYVSDCLSEYCGIEYLMDDNKYFCDSCNSKQNASRQIQLRPDQLPRVLTLQLMRFVYDLATGAKKKAHDSIRIEPVLDLTQILPGLQEAVIDVESTETPKSYRYRLVAVLNHKGTSAHAGHYTAQIRHPTSTSRHQDEWFEFDDAVVEIAKDAPAPIKSSGKKRKMTAPCKQGSRNAYMLMYERIDDGAQVPARELSPPEDIAQEIRKANDRYQSNIAEFKRKEQTLLNIISQRKDHYNKLFTKAVPYVSKEQKGGFYWVDTAWLKAWITGEVEKQNATKTKKASIDDYDPINDPVKEITHVFRSPLNLTSFMCPHQKQIVADMTEDTPPVFTSDALQGRLLDCKQSRNLKRVQASVFDEFIKTCGIESSRIAFSDASYSCRECLKQAKSSGVKNQQLASSIKEQLSLLNVKQPTGAAYYVSRKFLSAHKKIILSQQKKLENKQNQVRKTASVDKSLAAAEIIVKEAINSDVLCEHNGFITNGLRQVRVIPEKLWILLTEQYPESHSLPAADLVPCDICLREEEKEKQDVADKKQARKSLFTQHKDLKVLYHRKAGAMVDHYSGMTNGLPESTFLYAVDRQWMMQWRRYIDDVDEEMVEAFDNSNMVCPHNRVSVPLRLSILFRGSMLSCEDWAAKNPSDTRDVELVSEREWQLLEALYHPSNTIACMIIPAIAPATKKIVWKVQFQGQKSERMHEDESTIRCSECENQVNDTYEQNLIKFKDKPMVVRVLGFGHAAPRRQEIGTVALSRSQRRSRSHASSRGYNIVASSTDQVFLIKCKIMEVSGFPPARQQLFVDGNELDANLSLQMAGVKADDAIYVKLLNASSRTSDADILPIDDHDPQQRENGFEGTIFADAKPIVSSESDSNRKYPLQHVQYWSCPACTYQNPMLLESCEMCTTPQGPEVNIVID